MGRRLGGRADHAARPEGTPRPRHPGLPARHAGARGPPARRRRGGGAGAARTGSDEVLDERARSAYRDPAPGTRGRDRRRPRRRGRWRAPSGCGTNARSCSASCPPLSAWAAGPGGSATSHDRARKAVTMRLRDVVARLDDPLPALARHLRAAVRTGRECCYDPEEPVSWRVRSRPTGQLTPSDRDLTPPGVHPTPGGSHDRHRHRSATAATPERDRDRGRGGRPRRSSAGCSRPPSGPWTCSRSAWASGSACTPRCTQDGPRPAPSWRRGPASPSATPGSGSSSRRSPGILEVETDGTGHRAPVHAARGTSSRCCWTRPTPAYLAPIVAFMPPAGPQVFDQLVDVYRTGEGIAWSDFPAEVVDAQAAFNRPAFTHELDGWLAAVPEIDDRLSTGPSRVADLACGAGWSTQALARRYPAGRRARLRHRRHLDRAGPRLGSGVRRRGPGRVRGVRPVGAGGDQLRRRDDVRGAARPEPPGAGAHVDPAVAGARRGAPRRRRAGRRGRSPRPGTRSSGCSTARRCSSACRARSRTAGSGTGAAIRPSTVRHYADEAGFASCEVAPIDHAMFRFYLLRAPA